MYIDDVLFIKNPEFEKYLGRVYPVDLEIKDTTERFTSAFYLYLLLYSGRDGQLQTFYYKRDEKRKRKRSDSVLWQKHLHPQNNPKSNVTTKKNATKNVDFTTIADGLRTVS